jgi:NADH-quinone oxidoreductase subunit D
MSPNTLLDNAPLNDSPLEEHRQTSYNQPTTPITDSTGATLAGFRPAEDLIIPGVEDVVEESTSHHHPRGTDAVSSSTMILNMGPQHPSTHGVLRLVLEVDGETVISLAPDIGYLHTGIEKTCEAKFYSQVTPMTDRIDYLCPMTNNTAYALAVEKLLGLEIPERAQYLRVLLNELTRIQSHLVWLGTHAMDIGALTVFLYCFREREDLLRIFEAISGQRMMSSYIRIGGVALEPPADIYEKIRAFLNSFPRHIEEYEGLLNGNPIWMGRLKGIGHLSAEDAIALGVTGPPLRASGVDFDVRRDMPYSSYEKFKFNVPVSNGCDVWARYLVRMEEMRESTKICHQALDLLAGLHDTRLNADAPKIVLPDREQMKTQMESLIHHFKIVTEGFQVPAGEATSSVEAPHGMMNYYVVSDGTAKPYRVHMRNADFATLQALETMCKGRLIADVVAVIGSIDIVLGAIDR